MAKKNPSTTVSIPAIKVKQWLPEWEKVAFDQNAFQSKPEPHFYLFSMRASILKSLTGVYRRSAKKGSPRAKDPNVQRGHEEERSVSIRDFVQYGYPCCDMTEANRNTPDAVSLRKPGWLPTAIVVNILGKSEKRDNGLISDSDLVLIDESTSSQPSICLPSSFSDKNWEPESIFPIEVIDGQHRLWAFEGFDPGEDFELPVVAFHGLDRSWQAYLFWSVNITPKRINRSLAFDLYPLLRKEDWLTKFSGHSIYRETRSQELVESLWSHPSSPWNDRINMLGENSSQLGTDAPMVTQAAWIRALMASFIKEWGQDSAKIGGLFGAGRKSDELTLPWNRAMQAALLIYAGQKLRDAVKASNAAWAKQLRSKEVPMLFETDDPAFYGKYSLLATDQGVRGFLQILNDLCYIKHEALQLRTWDWETISSSKKALSQAATNRNAVDLALDSLKTNPISQFVTDISQSLSTYDWRTSSTPGLSEDARLRQAVFRGSGGYKELRRQLLQHLKGSGGDVGKAASEVIKTLGY